MIILQPWHAYFRLVVFIAGETLMLLVFLAAPVTLESVLVTFAAAAALFTLWRYGGRP